MYDTVSEIFKLAVQAAHTTDKYQNVSPDLEEKFMEALANAPLTTKVSFVKATKTAASGGKHCTFWVPRARKPGACNKLIKADEKHIFCKTHQEKESSMTPLQYLAYRFEHVPEHITDLTESLEKAGLFPSLLPKGSNNQVYIIRDIPNVPDTLYLAINDRTGFHHSLVGNIKNRVLDEDNLLLEEIRNKLYIPIADEQIRHIFVNQKKKLDQILLQQA